MKKRMFVTMLISMVVMMCNAQYITKISERDGVIYLSNGATVSYETVATQMAAQGLRADQLRPGESLQFGAMRQTAENYTKEIERRGYNTPANIYGGVYGGVYGGIVPMIGGKSFSIGNQHWGFSTSSSNWGGYKASSTGLRIGSFQIGGSTSGFVGLDSPSYTNQKKADAKKAAARYSATRSTVSGNSNSSSTRTATATTNTTSSKSDTINDLFGGF